MTHMNVTWLTWTWHDAYEFDMPHTNVTWPIWRWHDPQDTCNTLQHHVTHCNTLQHTLCISTRMDCPRCRYLWNCKTLQHSATHCNTLQHTLQHTAAHCSTLIVSTLVWIVHVRLQLHTLQHTATHCNTRISFRLVKSTQNGDTGWRRVTGCLIFMSFSAKEPYN